MRKQEWKKILSAVVAASMVFSLAPINVGTASAQTEQTAASGEKTAAQSITDVLDQGIKDTTNYFGVSAWYFPKTIEGVVDAGTLYLEGTGNSWILQWKGKNWERDYPDRPIKTLIVKDANMEQYAFSDLKELKKVKLEGVPSIGNQGFANCPNLQEMDLGEALTSLETSVFANDLSLTHIRIPAGVTKLKSGIFYNCTNLRDVAICTTEAQPDMGSTAATTFASTQSLIYCASGRGGMEHPFGGCSDLIIYVESRGNGIETAMDFTYKDCVGGNWTSLSSVTYSVSTLDQYEAKKETVGGELSVSCPDVAVGDVPSPAIVKNETGIDGSKVKWLYYNKDRSLVSKEEATQTMGMSYVKAVLQDDTHFVRISDFVPFQVQAPIDYTVEDGVLKIAPKPGKENVAIPDFADPSSTREGEIAAPWKDEKYSSIEIADGIISIGDYAFCGSDLEVADLSATNVTSVGSYAFQNCKQLVRVSLPKTLEELKGSGYLGGSTFDGCSSLWIVEGLEQTKLAGIPRCAFQNCSALNNIQIPASVTKIQSNAFLNCTNLINVLYDTGAEGTVSLAANAFSGCTALENMLLSGKNVTIFGNALKDCSALKKLTIKGVTGEADSALKITASAFTNVQATVFVPNATVQSTVRDRLSGNDFYAGDADKEESAQQIKVIATGDNSDIAVKKLSFLSIKLEEDALDPGQAFAPSVVEKTGDGDVTYWYYKLEDGKYVLADPENPATVPSQVGTYFIQGRMAATENYYACTSNMLKCIVNGTVNEDAFTFDSKTGILSIKKDMGSLDALQAVFSNYQELIKEVNWTESEEGYTSALNFQNCTKLVKAENVPCTTSFNGCISLESVLFSKDFSSEYLGAYTGCSSLRSINIPLSVKTISSNAFQDCTALQEINFLRKNDGMGSLDSIEAAAFRNCTSLKQISIPKHVNSDNVVLMTEISKNAFEGCSALEIVESDGRCEVRENAFQDCIRLRSVKWPGAGESGGGSIYRGAFTNAGTEADRFVVTVPGSCMVYSYAFADSGVTEIILGSFGGYQYGSLAEYALADASRLESITLQEMNYTSQKAPGIVNKNFTAGCSEDLMIYAFGDTYNLLLDSGYTNVVDYKTVTEAKKAAFAAGEEIYKGLDASLYDAEALQDFLENTLPVAKDLVEDSTGESSTLNVFEQADIIDQAEAFLAEAYFGEGGLAEVPAAAVAKLTDGLEEAEYTAESWKALTDAQAAVAAFLETQAEGATSAQASEFEGLVKAAKAVQLVKKAEAGTPTPEPGKGTPEPGKETPEPGQGTPEPGKGTPEPGKGTPEPGKGTPEPGKGTPEPGKGTPEPGQGTPEPGKGTPEPGQNTPAPGQGNTAPGQGIKSPGQGTTAVQVPKLAAVKISKVTAKKKSVVIKWKKRAGAKGYQLSYSLKKNFKGAKTVSIKSSKTSYTIKKLKKGKTYYIRIRAYNTSSGKKQYGKWSAKKKVKIKK